MRRTLTVRAGFTLLELLASLGLILLLCVVLFPVYLGARDRALRTACQSNLGQLGTALHLYAQDHDGRFPPTDREWAPVMPHVKNIAVFACPGEPRGLRERFRSGQVGGAAGEPIYSSYLYRGGLANDDPGGLPLAEDWEPWHGGRDVLYLGGYVQWVPDRRAGPSRPLPPR